jgi:hypothetical protein
MTKKNQKNKKPEITELELAASPADSSEAEKVRPEGASQPSVDESIVAPVEAADSSELAYSNEESSPDNLLDDVRRSLIEDETAQDEKKSKKWWRRISKSKQKDNAADVETPPQVEIDLPPVSMSLDVTEQRDEPKEPQESEDEIDQLIGILETESEEKAPPAPVEVEIAPEPEPEVDIEELKKQAFRPREENEEQENFTEVRSVALEGGEEVFVEVEATPQDPWDERLKALENALRPYRQYIYFGFAFLGALMAVIAAIVLINIYRQSQPQAPTTNPNLPFPTSMSLPGGLNFALGKGTLKDGEWNPRGPEWLEGTEVCRWVAIPWSRQLEAVIRTLKPRDEIGLVMSNNDRLTYKVYSVSQLSNEELQKLQTDTPCLLLVLAKADTDTRWVLTALP